MDRRTWQERFRSGFNKTSKEQEKQISEDEYMRKLKEEAEKQQKQRSMFQGIKDRFRK